MTTVRDEQLMEALIDSATQLRYMAMQSRTVTDSNACRLLAEKLESMADSWRTDPKPQKQIWKAHWDKPHRCPVCWRIPDIIYDSHSSARLFYIYTCPNGHRFSRLPIFRKEYEYEPLEKDK